MENALYCLDLVLDAQRTKDWQWQTKITRDGLTHTTDYRKIFKDLLKYFNNDDTGKYNIWKGVLLGGANGTGKSTFLKTFSLFTRKLGLPNAFKLVPCQDIIDQIHLDGSSISVQGYYQIDNFYEFGFDEIGKESICNVWGTKIDPIEQILCQRLNRGLVSHGTTNLTKALFKQRYGQRLHSRLPEIFNMVKLTGKDNRA